MEGSPKLDFIATIVAQRASSARLVRAADQVLLHIAWQRLVLEPGRPGAPSRLVLAKGVSNGLLIVGFPPQHVREEGRDPTQKFVRSTPRSQVAHCSRVVLRLEKGDQPITFTVSGVLAALSRLSSRVVALAQQDDPLPPGSGKKGPGSASPGAPGPDETAIEIPGRLVLSPGGRGRWANTAALKADAHPVELWHARLGASGAGGAVDERDAAGRSVRAVFQRAGEGPANSLPRQSQRMEIVRITTGAQPGVPAKPVDVNLLALTTFGGWLDSELHVPRRPEGLSLSLWRHVATLGRDQHVKVVAEGFLFPWGHRAAQVEIVDRVFDDGGAARLLFRKFLIVRQPVVTHRLSEVRRTPEKTAGARAANEWPFVRTEIRTRITPDLAASPAFESTFGCFQPSVSPGGPVGAATPVVPFEFLVRLHTLDGAHVDTLAPAYFVPDASRDGPGQQAVTDVVDVLAARWNESPARLAFGGRRIPLAAPGGGAGTAVGVQWLEIWAATLDNSNYERLTQDAAEPQDARHPIGRWLPRICQASVILAVAGHFTGRKEPVKVKYQDTYLGAGAGGFSTAENPGAVFLEVVPFEAKPVPDVPFDFSKRGDRTGGMVQPSFAMAGLSRDSGPVGGTGNLSAVATTKGLNPASFFGAMDPLIFGVVPLKQLIPSGVAPPAFVADSPTRLELLLAGLNHVQGPDTSQLLDNVRGAIEGALAGGPAATFDAAVAAVLVAVAALEQQADRPDPARQALMALLKEPELARSLALPRETRLSFDWMTSLVEYPPFYPVGPKGAASLEIRVESTSPPGTEPRFDMTTTLRNATLKLIGDTDPLGFIEIAFNELTFSARDGEKPDIRCDLGGVEFVGVLTFVNALTALIPANGFSDPPALTVTASGVTAEFSLALPDIAFGVFSLQNLALNAGFTVPFIASPMSAGFGFCTREAPALLTVNGLGGGGFLAIAVNPSCVEVLEAGFEFGASVAMNFGVASGEVHVFGGFIYAMIAGKADLTGYLRIGGSVEALGLVSVSIELTLSLQYEFPSKKCIGAAELEIEVSVTFFSVSVRLRVERRFGGADGDPPFIEAWKPIFDDDPWRRYMEAFA